MKTRKDATISARITRKLNADMEAAAKKLGISKNEFIERAIIHELNNNHKNNDKIVLDELLVLHDVLQERIQIRQKSQSKPSTELYDISYYINIADTKMQERGVVTESFVKTLANRAGVTFLEFTQAALNAGVDLTIV